MSYSVSNVHTKITGNTTTVIVGGWVVYIFLNTVYYDSCTLRYLLSAAVGLDKHRNQIYFLIMLSVVLQHHVVEF